MNTCFGKEYSNTYDLFYEQKNYIAECDFLENLFKKHSLYPKSILDIGCGTGNHMIPLLDRGYKVSGIDQSKEMLRIASAKRPEIQNDLYQSDMTCFSLNEKFDLAISMFAVVSYLTDNKQLYDSLHCIKSHLNEGGAFIFDCWSGPAVLSKRPLQSHKIVTLPNGGECVRLSNPLLNIETNCVLNNFDFLFMDKHKKVTRILESHKVRYFFPVELEQALADSGFTKVYFYPFLDERRSINENDWYLTVLAIR